MVSLPTLEAEAAYREQLLWFRIMALSAPIIALLGAAIVPKHSLLGGLLMAASVVAMAYFGGLNLLTALPIALIGIASALALISELPIQEKS
jgi:hypothetical protein